MYEKYHEAAEGLELAEFCNLLFTVYRDADNLTWPEVSEIIKEVYGVDYTPDCCRKKKARLVAKAKKQEEFVEDRTQEEDPFYEIKLLKYKLADERSQANAALRRISREETLKEIALEVANQMNLSKQLSSIPPTDKNIVAKRNKIGVLLIGDWHYGLIINNQFNHFDTNICIQRVNELLTDVIDICYEDRLDKLIVVNLGDMISGNIHLKLRLNTRIDVISQTINVSEILAEFLSELTNHIKVEYISVYDNHSRIDPKKQDSLELENLCRITDWYLRTRLEKIQNFSFLIDEVTDVANIKIYDYEVAFTHGHKDTPSTLIKNLNSFCNKHLDLICSAHYHHFSADESCNTFMVSNGSLMGTDDFAYDLRLNSPPSQTLIEISKDNVTESIKKINLFS